MVTAYEIETLLASVDARQLRECGVGDYIDLDSEESVIVPAVIARRRGKNWTLTRTGYERVGSLETFWLRWECGPDHMGPVAIVGDGSAVKIGRRWFRLERRTAEELRERWEPSPNNPRVSVYRRESTHRLRCVYVA